MRMILRRRLRYISRALRADDGAAASSSKHVVQNQTLKRTVYTRGYFGTVPSLSGYSEDSSLSSSDASTSSLMNLGHRTEKVDLTTGTTELQRDLAKYLPKVREMNAEERIKWAGRNFPGHVAMTTSFGIDSAVLLHFVTRLIPEVPVVWIDTGYLPPETYRYAYELQEHLDLNLFVSTSAITPARMEATYGKLWEHGDVDSHKLYGLMRKNEPLKRSLRDLDVRCLMVGLRKQQTKHRASLESLSTQYDAMKLLPLLEWSKEEMINYAKDHKLPQHPLKAQGYVTVGDWHSSRPKSNDDGDDERASRFGGVAEECGLHTDGITATPEAEVTASVAATVAAITAVDKKSQTALDASSTLLGAYNIEGDAKHPTVLMVKKRMQDGEDCRRCKQIQSLIERDSLTDKINDTLHVVEGDNNSVAAKLSREFGMRTAPFFVVRMPGSDEFKAFESYFKFKKVLQNIGSQNSPVSEERGGPAAAMQLSVA